MTKNLDDRTILRAAEQARSAAGQIEGFMQGGALFLGLDRLLGLDRDGGSIFALFAVGEQRAAVLVDPIVGLVRLLQQQNKVLETVDISVLSMGDDTAFDIVGNQYDVTGYFGGDLQQIEDPTLDDKIERATHVRLERDGFVDCVWRMKKDEMVARRIGC